MSDWKDRLADVDDDYLIGLSNKGIVKRAYKDKGEIAAKVQSQGEEASVTVGEETVTVRYPLGESKCTCPSRSICRHVVQAILVLKESCLKDGENGQPASEMHVQPQPAAAAQESGGKPAGEAASKSVEKTVGESVQQQDEDSTKEQNPLSGPQKPKPESAQSMSSRQSPEAPRKTVVIKEIEAYPFAKLKKALGNRQLQTFVNQMAANIRPEIQYSSVVTVNLPGQEFVVKLLSPLEYSSCTCHKKELCQHKAAAILWCQLETGTVTKEALLGEAAEAPEYDMAEIRTIAGQMREFLEELLGTGLSRVSPDVLDYLERLAIISHNAELARFEGYFRALADSYDRYLKRKAAFQTRDLMAQMARLYRRVELLAGAKDGSEVAKLAGEFRADYLPVGNLDLIGIAMEHFQSQTGYEGETIYFLEENTKKWYTYTNARPVYYDSRKRRGYTEKSQSPWGSPLWGLNISFENLLKVRIHLTGAKCDERNRLSSSQDTRGEVTGEQRLRTSDLQGWYYRDFDKMFLEQIGKQQTGWLSEQDGQGAPGQADSETAGDGAGGAEAGSESGTAQAGNGEGSGGQKGVELVFVRPDSCAKAEFSQTGQQLTLPLYDKAGRELLVEVTYSKQESGTIRYLERVSEKKLPCFLGKVYLKDGRMRMYPVDLLDIEEELDADAESSAEEGQSAARTLANEEDAEDTGTLTNPESQEPQAQKELREEVLSGRKSRYEVIEDITGEVLSLAEDLYQSGFDTVHDSTWNDIRKAAELTEQYGMKYLSELLSGLSEEIAAARHRMERNAAPMAELFTRLNEYLYICRQKTAYDRGANYYIG